eukprot:9909949-Heterocapsa_arctica.AAC.1
MDSWARRKILGHTHRPGLRPHLFNRRSHRNRKPRPRLPLTAHCRNDPHPRLPQSLSDEPRSHHLR